MTVSTLVKRSTYHDSVSLMLVAQALAALPGVVDAAVVMGTEANKAILQAARLLSPEAAAATADDLVIAVEAPPDIGPAALERAQALLTRKRQPETGPAARPRSLRGAIRQAPQANLAVISVAGRYAADEAWQALRKGLHVLLFSDNVDLEDEIALKRYAAEQGLLLMGPGAGTAILNGVALGFANAVPSGPVGVVSAAGTGLQEVTCLLAAEGVGITQGIGVGGRDLSEAVGGSMMLEGIRALQADPATEVLLLVSKPPAPSVAASMLALVATGSKPAVVCFLGAAPDAARAANSVPAQTLHEAALYAARLIRRDLPPVEKVLRDERRGLKRLATQLRAGQSSGQRYLRGLFSGGTLCYEAQVIWRELLSERVGSNAPLSPGDRLPDSSRSRRHTALDLGEEEFTVGRPHPMIDNSLRLRRLLQEAADPHVAAIMLDVVLGYGAHPDPASEIAPAIAQAQAKAGVKGRQLPIVVSVTGTDLDPQGKSRQASRLRAAGAQVCGSNAAAAQLAAWMVAR